MSHKSHVFVICGTSPCFLLAESLIPTFVREIPMFAAWIMSKFLMKSSGCCRNFWWNTHHSPWMCHVKSIYFAGQKKHPVFSAWPPWGLAKHRGSAAQFAAPKLIARHAGLQAVVQGGPRLWPVFFRCVFSMAVFCLVLMGYSKNNSQGHKSY